MHELERRQTSYASYVENGKVLLPRSMRDHYEMRKKLLLTLANCPEEIEIRGMNLTAPKKLSTHFKETFRLRIEQVYGQEFMVVDFTNG